MSQDYQVGPGTVVRLSYAVFDAEGERVETSDQTLEAVVGFGRLLPAIERAIEGLTTGASRSITLPPQQAFGRRDKHLILEVDRDEFPPEVSAGDRFEAEHESGGTLVLKVLEVLPDAVVVDTNHPLADQEVRFDLRILEVRPATEAELEAAAKGAGAEDALEQHPQLISPDRLLRPRTQS